MYDAVLGFWFSELKPQDWFKENSIVDEQIAKRFGELYQRAVRAELYEWRASAEGSLAEIILLDQFSRNLYRTSAKAFAQDGMALVLAQAAVQKHYDRNLNPIQKAFLYMPYMHSESKLIHQLAENLYDQPGLEDNLVYELKHKAIIDRFGRYPHRNDLLGRISTPEELAFLKEPDSSF